MCIRDSSNADINAEIKQTNKELTVRVTKIAESNREIKRKKLKKVIKN